MNTAAIGNTTGTFDRTLEAQGLAPLRRGATTTLQINVGKFCNQTCHHCHVEAGPKRTERMSAEVAQRVLWLLERSPGITTVDITGGAPELNANFRSLVSAARSMGRTVIDRCNLTVFFESGEEDLPEFLAAHQVEVIASLPCYTAANVDQQRGRGVFDKSIRALKQLNELGYGKESTDLNLHLAYNPLGPSLPPPQSPLEAATVSICVAISGSNSITCSPSPTCQSGALPPCSTKPAAMNLIWRCWSSTSIPPRWKR